MPGLIQQQAGITHLNTQKIIIRGHEGGVGAGNDIIIDSIEDYLIQEIWDTIYQSRPYSRWALSGFTEVELYSNKNSLDPDIILHVNETGMVYTSNIENGYRCPGLTELIDRLQRQALNAH